MNISSKIEYTANDILRRYSLTSLDQPVCVDDGNGHERGGVVIVRTFASQIKRINLTEFRDELGVCVHRIDPSIKIDDIRVTAPDVFLRVSISWSITPPPPVRASTWAEGVRDRVIRRIPILGVFGRFTKTKSPTPSVCVGSECVCFSLVCPGMIDATSVYVSESESTSAQVQIESVTSFSLSCAETVARRHQFDEYDCIIIPGENAMLSILIQHRPSEAPHS